MRQMLGLLFALLACGCSTMSITSYSSDTVDFSKLKTYSWMLGPPPVSGSPLIDQRPELERAAHEAIDQALAKRGYVKDTSGHPDFLVSYHATLNKKVSVQTLDQSSGYRPSYLLGGSGRITPLEDRETIGREYVDTFDEGTLIIDVVDPKTNQLIWRSTAKDEVNFKKSPEHNKHKIEEAVDKMLDRFAKK
jgi:hypothetical protein